jgi:hypothetical protein
MPACILASTFELFLNLFLSNSLPNLAPGCDFFYIYPDVGFLLTIGLELI